MNPTMLESSGALEDQDGPKDRLVNALQAVLQETREELSDVRSRLLVTEAKLDESRRALYECMGFRA